MSESSYTYYKVGTLCTCNLLTVYFEKHSMNVLFITDMNFSIEYSMYLVGIKIRSTTNYKIQAVTVQNERNLNL